MCLTWLSLHHNDGDVVIAARVKGGFHQRFCFGFQVGCGIEYGIQEGLGDLLVETVSAKHEEITGLKFQAAGFRF